MKEKIIVVFRYDDYTATSPLEVEYKLFEVFNRTNTSFSVGVVPLVTHGDYNSINSDKYIKLSDEKIQLLKKYADMNTVDIVLHGFNHNNCSVGKIPTEFSHVGYEEQFRKIKKGKEIIESSCNRRILSFIPPWNTYDVNTLLCLKENEIMCLSANRYGPSIDDSDLKYLPITIEFKDIDSAIAAARRSNAENQIISVLLHPYDFISSGDKRASIDWPLLEDKLKTLKLNPVIQVLNIGDCLKNKNIDLSHARYKANTSGFFENIYPPFIKITYEQPIYKDTKNASLLKTFNRLKALFFYALVAFLIFISIYSIDLNIEFNKTFKIINFSIVAICVIFIMWKLLTKSIYFNRFLFLYVFSLSVFLFSIINY